MVAYCFFNMSVRPLAYLMSAFLNIGTTLTGNIIIPSECQTCSLDPGEIWPDILLLKGPDLGPNCLQMHVFSSHQKQRTCQCHLAAGNIFFNCMLGNFSCFCCRLLTFFNINFFKKFFQKRCQSVNEWRS